MDREVTIESEEQTAPQEVVEEENPIHEYRGRITLFTLLAFLVFSAVFVFAAVDTYAATDLTIRLHQRFMEGLSQVRGYLSYFDFLVLGLAGLLFWKFGVQYRAAHPLAKVFFAFAAVCFVLDLINPNGAATTVLGMALLGDVTAYIYLILLFVVLFMPDEAYIATIERLFPIFVTVLVIRSGMLFALWLAGKGNYAFGMNSILTEADTLFVYALVCSVTLSLFLTRRRLLYFIPWAATFVVQVLSFRRSALFVVLVTNVATVMLHLWLSGGGMRLMKNSLAILAALAVISLVVAEVVPQDVLQIYVLRYFGMFTEAGQDRTSLTSDSGHFEESRATIEHAYNRGSFWGYGFGDNSRINVPGATARLWVHNVYAAAWIYSGLYMFLFYVFLFLMAVYLLVNTIRQQAANGSAYTLIMSSVSIFLIMMMVSWYTNPIHMAQSLKMRTLWSMAFAFLLKTNPGNFAYLFGESGASEDER